MLIAWITYSFIEINFLLPIPRILSLPVFYDNFFHSLVKVEIKKTLLLVCPLMIDIVP